jgi:predicted metal-dependent peptidase
VARRPPDPKQRTVEDEVAEHPLLRRLPGRLRWLKLPHEISARVVDGVEIHLNAQRRYTAREWLWLIAHARLHIALGHPWDVRRSSEQPIPHAVARCLVVDDLLVELGIGTPPAVDGRAPVREQLPERDVDRLVQRLQADGIPERWMGLGGVIGGPDVVGAPAADYGDWSSLHSHRPWTREAAAAAFASAIREALADSIDQAGGVAATDASGEVIRGPAMLAARWIRTHLPVIGALLDRYRVVADVDICRRMDIRVAAISDAAQEIYLNPATIGGEAQYRFVLAHELLHAGLRHGDRCGGRDHDWWNAACDFAINGWLVEMGVGAPPALGGLYDPALKGMSADQVYDAIQARLSEGDITGFADGGDILGRGGARAGDWADLDAWCRKAMLDGLELHEARRGSLPSGLIEAVRALAQPAIAWDVELAKWFEREIGALPMRRSYARPSRRQMATPDIPRPRWQADEESERSATFGAVIDSSGSMDRVLLGKALGAVASYAMARNVRHVRVIFCDAAAYDAGWIEPERLLERVEVRGRGGTVLQPGIDLLERAEDFPRQGPLLIVTDGQCDRFVCRRTHAILTPAGARLPFVPRGEVFRLT